jgi:multicomponent K+:H+ antiporter subunit D
MEIFIKHLPILPIAIPLMGAALALLVGEKSIARQQTITWICIALMLGVSMVSINHTASGYLSVYLVGNWQAPFGIALALDKLSAIMLLLTSIIAAVVMLAAQRSQFTNGAFFIPLFLLQLMGLNGAFLTADLFNLFVFFEVLLAASYGLLLQQVDKNKTNAATHYVVINLIGSALFLIAASLLYGITGTLNMADLSVKINALPPASRPLAVAAGFILLTVFAIKAALLPLNFWLTGTYRAATLPIAALFALMTKVGVVAIIRTLTLLYPDGTFGNVVMTKALIVLAPITMLVAALGALASRDLKTLVGWSIVASAGMLVTSAAIGNAKALSGGLFYLVGSTIASASLFLLAAGIQSSGTTTSSASSTDHRATWQWTGGLFLLCAMTLTAMPPFSGFIGKAVILAGAAQHLWPTWLMSMILVSGFISLIAYVRLGSRLFFKDDASVVAQHGYLPMGLLAGLIVAMTIFAAPIQRFTDQAAIELRQPQIIEGNVLGKRPMDAIKKVGPAK